MEPKQQRWCARLMGVFQTLTSAGGIIIERHKVCEVHSKTPKVIMIGGREREQRFCQQCSRFHLLVEFDEAKRSCRKRLDGHNRRRRKPQLARSLEPFTISSESLFSNHQGIRLLPFSVPQLFSSAADPISMWTGPIKTDDDAKVYIRSPSGQQSSSSTSESASP